MLRKAKLSLILLIITFAFVTISACHDRNSDNITISTDKAIYNLVLGESLNLNVLPSHLEYTFDVDNDNVQVDKKGNIKAQRVGTSHIDIRHGKSTKSVVVNIYNRIITKSNICIHENMRYSSIGEGVQYSKDGDVLYIESGAYQEFVDIDKNITLVGDDDASMLGVNVQCGKRVLIKNITFYSREYLGKDKAFINVGENASISVDSCKFLIDKKTDKGVDRCEGYAIYVCPNSILVNIDNCQFQGFMTAVRVDSAKGNIRIKRNVFSNSNKGIMIDVIDYESALPKNNNVSGDISDNTFLDVANEVEFIFAGTSYDGALIVEKHDKL